jgi:glucosamine--fructose-6-phosphate aminotransferase (isomerizing)
MCGTFGLVSNNIDAPKNVHKGLMSLEYRGYDSFGIACSCNGKLSIIKKCGAPSKVIFNKLFLPNSNIAIGHSRWATHGSVCEENAHPHFNENKTLAITHNGIIDNYLELKEILASKGHVFNSETDSEVIVHLVEEELKKTDDLSLAFRLALQKIQGRYAILLISKDEECIYAARNGSPLIIGRAKGENVVASDTPAILPITKIVNYLDDGEMSLIKKDNVLFFNILSGESVVKRDIELNSDFQDTEKGDYKHYMIKEIWEQRDTIARSVNQNADKIKEIAKIIKKAKGVFLVGCGSAAKACSVAEYFFAKAGKIHTNSVVASEFMNFEYFLNSETLMIAVSQSGETADLLEAMKIAKTNKVKILAIVNVANSSVARESDYVFCINAGIEKAVASTKATTAQMTLLLLIAYAVDNRLDVGRRLLVDVVGKVSEMLNPRYFERIENLAKQLYPKPNSLIRVVKKIFRIRDEQQNLFIIGKGYNYPMAMEAAIKIMEVSYVHAQGFAGGELKHGPIALVEKDVPIIALCANDENWISIQANCQQAKSRHAMIIGVGPENSEVFDYWLKTPVVSLAQPIINIIPVQILSYYLSLLKGLDPDQPRNLAKSVTVV